MALHAISLFEESQVSVEKKLLEPETTIVSACIGETPPQNNITRNSSISVINILKDRISFLENELSKKDTIINYLSNELITLNRSKSQDSTNGSRSTNIYESITVDNYANDTIKETTIDTEKPANKTRVIITGDSLLNGINEKGLSKDKHAKIKKFLGGTTETISGEVEELVKNKLDTLIVQAGTNDLMNGKNVLNNVKKVIKLVKRFSPQTKLGFSSLIIRKNKKNVNKELLDKNTRLRLFFKQKNIGFLRRLWWSTLAKYLKVSSRLLFSKEAPYDVAAVLDLPLIHWDGS